MFASPPKGIGLNQFQAFYFFDPRCIDKDSKFRCSEYISGDYIGVKLKLKERKFQGQALQGANFNGAYLNLANFEGSNLESTTFFMTHLWRANFSKANLRRADFQWARLRKANFEMADLQDANFQFVNAPRANFQKANLRGANFENAENLRAVNFKGAYYDEATRFPTSWGKNPRETREYAKKRGLILKRMGTHPGEYLERANLDLGILPCTFENKMRKDIDSYMEDDSIQRVIEETKHMALNYRCELGVTEFTLELHPFCLGQFSGVAKGIDSQFQAAIQMVWVPQKKSYYYKLIERYGFSEEGWLNPAEDGQALMGGRPSNNRISSTKTLEDFICMAEVAPHSSKILEDESS